MTPSEPGAGTLDYDEYVRLIRQVDELVAGFEGHPDEATRERVLALLTSIDLLHRNALNRLSDGLRDHGAGPALERVLEDRVVETLFGLYDLAELEVPAAPEPEPEPANLGFVPREKLTFGRGPGREP